MSGPGVRVLVWYREPEGDPGSLHRAFEETERAMAGTPGLLRSELLTSLVHAGSVAVHSEWTSVEAFLTWERGPDHHRDTGALRPYQDEGRGVVYDVYEVSGKEGDGGGGS